MASYRWGADESFIADADFSDKQYYCVVSGSVVNEVSLASEQGGSILGILQNDPKDGEEAIVRVIGFSTAIANARVFAMTVGGVIRAASNGMVEAAAGSMCASAFCIGTAMNALASGSGDHVEVLITPFGFRA